MLSFHSGQEAVTGGEVLGEGEGGIEVDVMTLRVTMSVIPPVTRLLNSFVTVEMSQSSLGRGLGVLPVGSQSLGAQGPVGGQHREPDGHGDEDEEGRGGE